MCCKGFLKIMMFVFNGGIFVAGATILGVGIWVQVDSSSLFGLLDNVEGDLSGVYQLANIAYLLIAVGAVLLIIGFLGCCGAIRESRCMLLTFFSIVLIIFLIEVAGAVVLFVFGGLADQLLAEIENEVRTSIRENYGKDESMTSLWNATMDEFKCCGYRNYSDFTGSPFNSLTGGFYPDACCNSHSSGGYCFESSAESSDIDGCFDKLLQLIEDNAMIIAAVALGIAALEIAAMVVSMILYCRAGDK
ncbi:tetraspanin 34a [Pholidichthys leucotaenia]